MPLINIQLGEVIFGGVGSGLYGILAFAIIAMFVAGLMVGRTPEYLGKKLEAREVKMTILALLSLPLSILGWTALATVLPAGLAGIANTGPHGFSEILYAYTSGTGNNGSAFAGISANTLYYNTTLAAAKLVFAGIPERYPDIKWVLSHLGGAIPYLAERFDRGWRAFPDCRVNINKPPSDYLRRFYFDTVNFDPNALRLAVDFAGASQILAGSDYPHQIGSIPLMKESLAALSVSDRERELIMGANAAMLYQSGRPD